MALITKNSGKTTRWIKSGFDADFTVIFLGLACLWEGVLKVYNHYNSIWADSEPLDYFIAGFSIAVGLSLLMTTKGLGRKPGYSFPLIGAIFGAFKIYTDSRDPGDILLSMILISGSLILLANSIHLERKWISITTAECWLTIFAWTLTMMTPKLFLWDYSLLFSWVVLFIGILLWITRGSNLRLSVEQPLSIVRSSGQDNRGELLVAAQLKPSRRKAEQYESV